MDGQSTNIEPRVRRSLRTRSQHRPLSREQRPLSSQTRRRRIDRPNTRESNSQPQVNHNSSSNTEVIEEDDICIVCQQLLYRPVTTHCNHTLCESCMKQWADICTTTQMTIVEANLDDEILIPDPVDDLQARCPMCRTQTSAALNMERTRQLSRKYPRTWSAREAEEDANDEDQQTDFQNLTLCIGNQHQLDNTFSDSENIHDWTFFVKPNRTDIVEEVQILLHPTFKPSRIIRTRPPYQIRRLGWGTFTITAYIILKAGYSWISDDAENSPDGAPNGMLPVDWTLDFDGFNQKGSMSRLRLRVRNDRDWRDAEEEVRDERERRRMVRMYQRDGVYEPPTEE